MAAYRERYSTSYSTGNVELNNIINSNPDNLRKFLELTSLMLLIQSADEKNDIRTSDEKYQDVINKYKNNKLLIKLFPFAGGILGKLGHGGGMSPGNSKKIFDALKPIFQKNINSALDTTYQNDRHLPAYQNLRRAVDNLDDPSVIKGIWGDNAITYGTFMQAIIYLEKMNKMDINDINSIINATVQQVLKWGGVASDVEPKAVTEGNQEGIDGQSQETIDREQLKNQWVGWVHPMVIGLASAILYQLKERIRS